jgi:argininosuccinate lyase
VEHDTRRLEGSAEIPLGNAEGRLGKTQHRLLVEGYNAANIEKTRFTFPFLIRYHKAYVVMLVEQGIVGGDAGRQLLGALNEIGAAGLTDLPLDPLLEDIHPNLECALIQRVGYAVGGNINLGRSRGEIVFVSEHLALREAFLGSLEANLRVRRALVELAEQHLHSVMPYYTFFQQAEPLTLGYYLAAFVEELERHHERLDHSYAELNVSLAGVGQIVPTSFPVDRRRLAELLGFERAVEHSLYGYYSVEAQVHALSALALMAATLSRLSLDFYVLASNEVDLVAFGDEFSGTSFIMPQKRNPYWLLPIRPRAVEIKALYGMSLEKLLHTPPMELGSIIDVPIHLHDAVGKLTWMAELTAEALRTLVFNPERGRQLAEGHYAQAVQIMHRLVEVDRLSWREAHLVVGALIRTALARNLRAKDLTVDMLDRAAHEVLGRPVRWTQADLARCLDALEVVKTREAGGPAPATVDQALRRHTDRIERHASDLAKERERLSDVWHQLDRVAGALTE